MVSCTSRESRVKQGLEHYQHFEDETPHIPPVLGQSSLRRELPVPLLAGVVRSGIDSRSLLRGSPQPVESSILGNLTCASLETTTATTTTLRAYASYRVLPATLIRSSPNVLLCQSQATYGANVAVWSRSDLAVLLLVLTTASAYLFNNRTRSAALLIYIIHEE